MGHLEACAAAAGLVALLLTPLSRKSVVSPNAQLRRLNVHLVSLVCAVGKPFRMPVEVVARTWNGVSASRAGGERDDDERLLLGGRLSSFGFSGTIAHGSFASTGCPGEFRRDVHVIRGASLYRAQLASSRVT